MSEKLNVSMIQRYYRAYKDLVVALYDAKSRYHKCFEGSGINRPFENLVSMSGFLKALIKLPHGTSLTPYEAVLKRHLVRFQCKLNGYKSSTGLKNRMPAVYAEVVQKHDEQIQYLLERLADVDIKTSKPTFRKVKDIKAQMNSNSAEMLTVQQHLPLT